MLLDQFHREDIKAAIRKRYRSLQRFERAENLTKGSVAEILRGRKSAKTEEAIRVVMADEVRWGRKGTMISDSSCDAA